MTDLKKDRTAAFKKMKKIVADNDMEAAIGAQIDLLTASCCETLFWLSRGAALAIAKSVAIEVEKEINKAFDAREGKLPH